MSERRRPSRLHHTAYVSTDLERTRRFYEDIIGLPLAATWCEADELFGKLRVYCHCFFELADKSSLAFFQFADPGDQAEFGPELPPSPFRHIALSVDTETFAQVERRVEAAGIRHPDTYILEHGYCRSLYVKDPDGMIVELTCDAPQAVAEAAVAEKRQTARAELARWLAGDHRSNNTYR